MYCIDWNSGIIQPTTEMFTAMQEGRGRVVDIFSGEAFPDPAERDPEPEYQI
jgi:hypothetical protein